MKHNIIKYSILREKLFLRYQIFRKQIIIVYISH